jgi:hypothetical protein
MLLSNLIEVEVEISTIRTITSHLKSLDIKKRKRRQMTLEIQILAWQRHNKWDRVKQVNGIPTLPS